MQILTIVTYNILADAFLKKDRYPHSCPESLDPTLRRKRLFGELDLLAADIYCLQEVEPTAYESIAAHLGDSFHGAYAPRKDAPDGLAVFSKKALRQSAPIELRDPSHGSGNELAGLATQVDFDGAPLGIATTHLRWRPEETPPAEHTGLKQLGQVLDHCDGAPKCWVISGDFNANSQSRVLAAAEACGYTISCSKQRPWDTTNINHRRRKIDYLLHTAGTLKPTAGRLPKLESRTPMPSLDYSSDHLPLKVEFTRR